VRIRGDCVSGGGGIFAMFGAIGMRIFLGLSAVCDLKR
jgi:hypothetical protein